MLLLPLLIACTEKPGISAADTTDTPGVTETSPDIDSEAPETGDDTQTTPPDTETSTPPDTDTAPTETGTTPYDDGIFTFSGPPPRNVLAISLETTRRDWFTRFGGPIKLPTLDALMDGGVVLENHRSCSNWTWASMVCAQASRSETELGWVANGAMINQGPAESTVMIDDVLQGLGYRTIMVSSNPFLTVDADTVYGFDQVIEQPGENASVVNAYATSLMASLAESDEQPWYLHLHYFDPHDPYGPPESYLGGLAGLANIPFDLDTASGYGAMVANYPDMRPDQQALVEEHIRVRYSGEMAFMDDQIGIILREAESLGLLEDTLIVLFADHGEQIWEHGASGHDTHLYEQENASVAAFSAPGLAPGAWPGPTLHQDIWPTALRLMGLDAIPDFTGVVVGERPDDTVRLGDRYLGPNTVQIAERQGLKLIYTWTGQKELYDLTVDPGEQTNLYDAEDPNVIALWDVLLPEVNALDALVEATPNDPGP